MTGGPRDDAASPAALANALYEVISGPADEPRDWDRFRDLFLPGARGKSRVGSASAEPVGRGVNSVQMVRRGGRWWIAGIAFELEGPGRPIPDEYLPGEEG